MKKTIIGLVAFFTLFFLAGCGGSGLSGMYNIARCEYKYNSISNLSLSGINLSNGISPLQAPRILAVLAGGTSSIPMNFTLNLDVKNPNATTAALSGLQYIINIDNIQFTTGQVKQNMNIASGATQRLPLQIGFDLGTLMQRESKSAVQNITKNFIGIGSDKSNVSVQIKPTFVVGGQSITSPIYFPVNFSFGGKK